MVKNTQTIRRQIADEWFECVWPVCDIGTLRVNKEYIIRRKLNNFFKILYLTKKCIDPEEFGVYMCISM